MSQFEFAEEVFLSAFVHVLRQGVGSQAVESFETTRFVEVYEHATEVEHDVADSFIKHGEVFLSSDRVRQSTVRRMWMR